MSNNRSPNVLITEKSPYLLQHAYNPVNWFPWSDEAFDLARRDNKPVFLSIGYSTCHWCHVMERESFEDEEVAALLNEHFVSIKVDREERPDVDHLYMAVCQAMTGQGGWPLTLILTPERKPFFAGTYFPKTQKYGRYGLMDILPQVVEAWQEEPDKLLESAEQIASETQKRMLSRLEGSVGKETIETAYELYAQTFDSRYGGFGASPKFPTPHNLSFLMRYALQANEPHALEMAELTLLSMYRGGMYDHIGYGFARYSTDERWLVPHFEKMLYDNALLAMTYAEAYQWTRKPLYRQVAEEIVAYVFRDMTSPEGGFYSAEDADSEGEEGKFYAWTPEQVAEVLGEKDGELFCDLYDITEEGNFEGRSIPNLLLYTPAQFAAAKGLGFDELSNRLQAMRGKLFQAREQRVRPGKDDKILTAWNGLMIMALAKAAKACGKPEYAEAAGRAARFIEARMIREDGRLLARYRDGEAAYLAYLDDYACLIWGLIELYEATFDAAHLRFAVRLSEAMVELFWDGKDGGFYFYGNDAEQLLTRMKEIYDGAQPSGNSVAALSLARLGAMTGEERWSRYAEQTIQAFGGSVERYPAGHAVLLAAAMLQYGAGEQIVIAGTEGEPAYDRMVRKLRAAFLPAAVLMKGGDESAVGVLPLTEGKGSVGGKPAVYVCERFACQAPITEEAEMDAWLERKRTGK